MSVAQPSGKPNLPRKACGRPSLELITGMVISHVWFGHGSALFLELGSLSEGRERKDGSIGNPIGAITVMIDFNWRVERQRSILGGSHDSKKRCISISQIGRANV